MRKYQHHFVSLTRNLLTLQNIILFFIFNLIDFVIHLMNIKQNPLLQYDIQLLKLQYNSKRQIIF